MRQFVIQTMKKYIMLRLKLIRFWRNSRCSKPTKRFDIGLTNSDVDSEFHSVDACSGVLSRAADP